MLLLKIILTIGMLVASQDLTPSVYQFDDQGVQYRLQKKS